MRSGNIFSRMIIEIMILFVLGKPDGARPGSTLKSNWTLKPSWSKPLEILSKSGTNLMGPRSRLHQTINFVQTTTMNTLSQQSVTAFTTRSQTKINSADEIKLEYSIPQHSTHSTESLILITPTPEVNDHSRSKKIIGKPQRKWLTNEKIPPWKLFVVMKDARQVGAPQKHRDGPESLMKV